MKDPVDRSGADYVLNPIYAPYFNISYRKRRKLSIKAQDLVILMRGRSDERRKLEQRFIRQWDVEPEQLDKTLFSYFQIGG